MTRTILCMLAILLLSISCSHATGTSSSPSITAVDSNENVATERIELIKHVSPNGEMMNYSIEVQQDTAMWPFALNCNGKQIALINRGLEDPELMDESGLMCMRYFLSPDGGRLFVVTQQSFAGSCVIFYKKHLYCLDLATGTAQWLANCGGVSISSDCFVIAEQVERLNPDSSCANASFTARNVYYNYNGNVIHRGNVMLDTELREQYGNETLEPFTFEELTLEHPSVAI